MVVVLIEADLLSLEGLRAICVGDGNYNHLELPMVGWCQRGRELFPAPLTLRFTCKSRHLLGALGRTRTCDLLIRSHSPSGTGRDSGGQGETKQRFYRESRSLKGHRGTGRDTQLRSDCGQNVCSTKGV